MFRLPVWFWFGSTPYPARFGRYYGFNLFNVFSVHYRTDGEIAVQLGKWFKFWRVGV
jgi:hypothetical protein